MEDFKWRHRARVAGCFSLFLSFFLVAYTIYLCYSKAVGPYPDEFMYSDFEAFVLDLAWDWLQLLILSSLAGIQAWSDVQILLATKVGQDPKIAWLKISIWLRCTLFFVCVGGIINLWNIIKMYRNDIFSGSEAIFWTLASIILPLVPYVVTAVILTNFSFELQRILTVGLSPSSEKIYMENLEKTVSPYFCSSLCCVCCA